MLAGKTPQLAPPNAPSPGGAREYLLIVPHSGDDTKHREHREQTRKTGVTL